MEKGMRMVMSKWIRMEWKMWKGMKMVMSKWIRMEWKMRKGMKMVMSKLLKWNENKYQNEYEKNKK